MWAEPADSQPGCLSSGGHHKIPQAGWLINSRNLFLTVLQLQVQDQGASVAWRRLSPGLRLLNACSLGRRGRELCGVSFTRALIPLMRAPPP